MSWDVGRLSADIGRVKSRSSRDESGLTDGPISEPNVVTILGLLIPATVGLRDYPFKL